MRPENINRALAPQISDSQPVDTGKYLFVPMHLSALVVAKRDDDMKWASITPDYPKLNEVDLPPLGESIQRFICDNPVSDPLHDRGVHLHWVLPDAYRHGLQKENDASPVFPLAPNRWLVTRFAEKAGQVKVKRWVVESDYIWPAGSNNNSDNDGGPNWLAVDKQDTTVSTLQTGDSFRTLRIGRWLPYEDWVTEPQNTTPPFLTIMAPGDPSFAASYTSSKASFGFYDSLDDMDETGTCSYSVMGWLSDASKGILAVEDGEKWLQKVNSLCWKVEGGTDKSQPLPGSVICHAMINNVAWDKESKTENGQPTKEVKISIGNTVAEALAVLIKQGSKKGGDATFLAAANPYLSAMQYNILADHVADKGRDILKSLGAEGGPDAGTRTQQTHNHSKGFRAISGGKIWQVARKEKKVLKDAQGKEETLPMQKETAECLEALNKLERDHDNKMSMLLSLLEQRYINWYRTMKPNPSGRKHLLQNLSAGEKTQLLSSLAKDNDRISQMLKAISGNGKEATTKDEEDAYKKAVKEAQDALKAAMANDPAYKDFEIKEANLPPYYLPNDPSIVIDGLQPSTIYARQDSILCRAESQLADTLSFDWASGSLHVRVPYKKLHQDMRLDYKGLPHSCASLMIENMLCCPLMAKAAAEHACDDKCSDESLAKLADEISTTSREWVKYKERFGREAGRSLMPETFCVQHREVQPWIPIVMEWEIEWYATERHELLNGWEFGSQTEKVKLNNIDYTLKQGSLSEAPTDTFKGRVALSSDLGSRVDKLRSSLGNPSLFAGMNPMHQSFSGLDRHFLTQDSGIQLPPLVRNNNHIPIVDEVAEKIEDQYLWSPSDREGFYPLRGGAFRIKNLFIIDAFGQNFPVVYDGSYANTPAKLQVPKMLMSTVDEDKIVLPPRICQPVRMRMMWMSATTPGKETDSNPATSPICGWMMHNKLDESIVFFDADGIALGSISIAEGDTLIWERPPGRITPRLLTANQDMNTHLGAMANMLMAGGKANFREMVRLMDNMAEKGLKAKKKSGVVASLPFGVPMAVVRAACALELNGLPARRQGLLTDDGGLLGTRFPFYVGSTLSRNDGVIAVHHYSQPSMLTMPFAQPIVTQGAKFATDNPVMLSLANGLSGPVTNMTLLMHPYMDVTISSGILPSASYELPDLNENKAMEKISMSFLVNPILIADDNSSNDKKKPSIPVPDIAGKDWKWLQQHYSSADSNNLLWTETELNSRKTQELDFNRQIIIKEGWLKLDQKDGN